jgi:hypothetical protein
MRSRTGPVGVRRDLLVQLGADPRHLRTGGATVRAQRLGQFVDLAHRGAGQILVHHPREQGLVDPAVPLQQAQRETTPPAASGSPAPDTRPSWTASAAGTRCAESPETPSARAGRHRSARPPALVRVSFDEFLGRYSRSFTRRPLNAQEAGPQIHHSTGRVPSKARCADREHLRLVWGPDWPGVWYARELSALEAGYGSASAWSF